MTIRNLINLIILFISTKLIAQNIPVGSIDFIEERLRNEQLMGNLNPDVSFTLRPLPQSLKKNSENTDTTNPKLECLPITLIQQYNTLTPMGRNDGSMIPARGYQTQLSMGLYASYRALRIQIKPEYVFAENAAFETFPTTENNNVRSKYIRYLNYSDLPERFGNSTYKKLNWGQSSISVAVHKFSIGLSTENLWWGPGKYNSLIMSNNAPGFLHLSLNTQKPIHTRIGSFEGQLIVGKLSASGFDSSDADYTVDGVNYSIPKQQQWRYINGISINYQPKWVQGLFVGLNRVFQIYHNDLGSSFSDYFPVITPFQKNNLTDEDAKNRDQIASVFLRWVMKESKSEIYVESGWNDHSSNFLDLFDSPSHSRAILFGFSKIFLLNSDKDNYLKFNFEHTQLQQSADRIVRPAGAWYEHGIVRHGYTQMSQVIGAGIGPGANAQTLDFSVWNKNKVWGIQCERYAHNLDFYYDASYTDFHNKWVDLNLNAYTYRRFGNMGIQAKLNTAWMRNYQWQLDHNKFNFQFQVSVQYHF